ncbi:MAG: hypothetical protein NT179_02670 [Nitrospirae bacterium]|nr:hypothetical protein [Nitrospirota bacterium]
MPWQAPVIYLQPFMTEGAGGGYLGGKTAELAITSIEATGSNSQVWSRIHVL